MPTLRSKPPSSRLSKDSDMSPPGFPRLCLGWGIVERVGAAGVCTVLLSTLDICKGDTNNFYMSCRAHEKIYRWRQFWQISPMSFYDIYIYIYTHNINIYTPISTFCKYCCIFSSVLIALSLALPCSVAVSRSLSLSLCVCLQMPTKVKKNKNMRNHANQSRERESA